MRDSKRHRQKGPEKEKESEKEREERKTKELVCLNRYTFL